MKRILSLVSVLIICTGISYGQIQYGVDKASTVPTSASPGFVFGWPQYASQNFLYKGQYLNLYGIGFYGFDDGNGISGINSYISSYFGVDIFTAGQRRFRINTDGSTSIAGKVAIGPSQNGASGDFEALSVYNTVASNTQASGNGTTIQFYNNAGNTNANGANTIYGASVKSVSANNQYGWESDLYLRTTRNNSYSSQTILDALVIKGGSGYVGIGTSAPLNGLNIFKGNDFNGGSIRFGHSGTYDGVSSFGYNAATGRDALKFSYFPHGSTTGQVDLMTLDVNGNVGIGTLDVGGNTSTHGDLEIGRGDGQDTKLRFHNYNSGWYSIGLDMSDGKFKINGGGNLGDATHFAMDWNGNVGIGNSNPDAKLTVTGLVHAQEVKVTVAAPGPDFVFEKDYQLTSLEEIKNYIDQNKHLPEVPSAKEMEKNGVQLGEMNMLLLKKIEELTLYTIEMNKKVEEINKRDEALQREIEELKKRK